MAEIAEEDFHLFIISDNYRWVLLTVALTTFYYMILGFVVTGEGRRDYMTLEFLEKEFGDEHERVTGQKISKGGYPDMGSGQYVLKAGYKAWYTFNIG